MGCAIVRRSDIVLLPFFPFSFDCLDCFLHQRGELARLILVGLSFVVPLDILDACLIVYMHIYTPDFYQVMGSNITATLRRKPSLGTLSRQVLNRCLVAVFFMVVRS